jgi:hypothetical protein
MSASFSQRIGAVPATKAMQLKTMDRDLRSHLWSAMVIFIWSNYPEQAALYLKRTAFYPMIAQLYMHHFKLPIDEIDDYFPTVLLQMKKHFMGADWHVAYSYLETVSAHNPCSDAEEFVSRCNSILELENSAYRFVGGKLAEIHSKDEIEEIDKAIEVAVQYPGVKGHLETALGFLADRKNPDYRNSIKESISAVESIARHITGDSAATLGQAIKVLEKKHNLHEGLKRAFSALYGYTNDADGIRHSLMDDGRNLTSADARFMLITCSAFINFVIDSTKD